MSGLLARVYIAGLGPATFFATAAIEGIHDGRAAQVALWWVVGSLALGIAARTGWWRVGAVTGVTAGLLVGAAATPLLVTAPVAFLVLATATVGAAVHPRCRQTSKAGER